jgi:hypothetical protein
MSLDGNVLGDAIITALQELGISVNPDYVIVEGPPQRTVRDMWRSVGTSIANHIKANGEILVTIKADSTGDGLQTDSLLQPTTHPATDKNISGTIA